MNCNIIPSVEASETVEGQTIEFLTGTNLNEGDNKIVICVTSSDKTTKRLIVLNVNRKASADRSKAVATPLFSNEFFYVSIALFVVIIALFIAVIIIKRNKTKEFTDYDFDGSLKKFD